VKILGKCHNGSQHHAPHRRRRVSRPAAAHQRSDKRSTGKSSTLEINTNLWRRQPALVTIHFVCVDSFDISVRCFYVGRRGKIDLFELCAFVSEDNVCALV